ncbi:hypothetical protein ACOJBM_13890 [Rhizobium beringeri]|jgi:hypothetical protein
MNAAIMPQAGLCCMAEFGGFTRVFGHAAVRHNRAVGKRQGLVDSGLASSGSNDNNAVILQLGD